MKSHSNTDELLHRLYRYNGIKGLILFMVGSASIFQLFSAIATFLDACATLTRDT